MPENTISAFGANPKPLNTIQNHELAEKAGHLLPLIQADPGSIYSSDQLEKGKSHLKLSSLPICSG